MDDLGGSGTGRQQLASRLRFRQVIQYEAGVDQGEAPNFGPVHVHVLNHDVARSAYRLDTVLGVESVYIPRFPAKFDAGLLPEQFRIDRVE